VRRQRYERAAEIIELGSVGGSERVDGARGQLRLSLNCRKRWGKLRGGLRGWRVEGRTGQDRTGQDCAGLERRGAEGDKERRRGRVGMGGEGR